MRYLMFLIISLVTFACSSYDPGSSYYGYDNDPKAKQNDDPVFDNNSNWSNPLNNTNNNQQDVVRNDNVNRTQYNGPVYVPVIVPWWNSYHGWGMTPRRRSGVYVHYSNYWGPEWYSPWYNYHPYHGVTWNDYWYVRPHYRHWYNQSVYTYYDRPIRRNEFRSYSSNRGTYSVYNPRGTNRSINNSRDYNPRSERFTSSGQNIYRRGEQYQSSPRSSGTRNTPTRTNTYSQPNNNSQQQRGSGNQRGNSNYSPPSRSSGSSAQPSRSSGKSRSGSGSSGSSRGSGSSRSSGSSRGR